MKRPLKFGRFLWILPLFALLAACGGSSGGGDSSAGSTACVLGTSTIGNCTL